MGAVSLLEDIVDRRIDSGRLFSRKSTSAMRTRMVGKPVRKYVRCPSCRIRINARNLNRHFRKTSHDC